MSNLTAGRANNISRDIAIDNCESSRGVYVTSSCKA